MYRFLLRPKWIGFHLLVVAGIVAMINLGLWQLRRLDERRDFNARIEARYDAAPRPLDALLAPGVEPDDVEWLPVTVTGRYLPDETVRIVNRSQNGFPGDNIVVAMQLTDGRLLLVNRGFLPLGIDVPAPPQGDVAVAGRLRQSQQRRLGQLTDPDGDLTEAQRVDIPRLSEQLDGDVIEMYVDAYQTQPADADVLEPVIKPDLSEGNHQSYAVQWFVFSVCVAVGWVLAVRHSLGKHRSELRQTSPPVDHADTP
jgi:cytochrome oxidase assembly protein ShyY1